MQLGWEAKRNSTWVLMCSLMLVGVTARAETPQTQPSDELTLAPSLQSEVRNLPQSPDSIDDDLEEAAKRPAGLFKYGPVSLLDPLIEKFNKATEDIGLNIGLSYTAVWQIASGGPGDRDA